MPVRWEALNQVPVRLTFLAKPTARSWSAGDALSSDRFERRAEGIKSFSNRMVFDDIRLALIRHGDRICLHGLDVLKMGGTHLVESCVL